jgi:hypothetical protein
MSAGKTSLSSLLGFSYLEPVTPQDRSLRLLRNLIYLYAIVWLVEGGLRRWVFPQLADPLLLIRDPLVLLIYFVAIGKNKFPFNGFVIFCWIMTFLSFGMAMAFGHGNVLVALYGVRTMALHIPLIFLMPKVFDLRHVQFMARWMLIITIPMAALLTIQFLSPPTAWVNRGVGGIGTAGFFGAMGKLRAPGTFSFVTGPALFFGFSTAAWFTILYRRRRLGLGMLLAGGAIVLACPVSISRTLLLSCAIVFLVGLFGLFRSGKNQFALAIRLTITLVILGVGLSFSKTFQEGTAAFADRWQTSASQGGGATNAVVFRFLDDIISPIQIGFEAPLFGYGIGIGSNFGAKMLLGRFGFIAGEGEFERMVYENGLILGWSFLMWRILIVIYLARAAWISFKESNPVPMVFLASSAVPLAMGQWSQPTALGFACFASGVVLAATRIPVVRVRPTPVAYQPVTTTSNLST